MRNFIKNNSIAVILLILTVLLFNKSYFYEQKEPIAITFETLDRGIEYQVFYKETTGDGYTEANSSKVSSVGGDSFNENIIIFNDANQLVDFRLDLGIDSGKVLIKNVKIIDGYGNETLVLNKDIIVNSNQIDDVKIIDDYIEVYSKSNDPYFSDIKTSNIIYARVVKKIDLGSLFAIIFFFGLFYIFLISIIKSLISYYKITLSKADGYKAKFLAVKSTLFEFEYLKGYWPQILFITMLLSIVVNPLKMFIGYNKFNKLGELFGHSTIYGIDASKRISNYSLYYIVIIPIFVLLSTVIIGWFTNKNEEIEEPLEKFFSSITAVCLFVMSIYTYNKYAITFNHIKADYSLIILGLIFLNTLFLIKYKYMSFEKFEFATYFSISAILLVTISISPYIENQPSLFLFIVGMMELIYLAVIIGCRYLDIERLKTSTGILFWGIVITSLALELTYILNQYNVFIVKRLFFIQVIILSLVVISIILYLMQKKSSKSDAVFNFSLIGLISGIILIGSQPTLYYSSTIEAFETSNNALLVYDTLNFGKFPIINSFDGHMMRISLDGIIYGILNSDPINASYVLNYINLWNVFIYVSLFYLIKKVFDKNFAMLFVLFTPLLIYIFPPDIIGVLSIYLMIRAIEKRSNKSYYLYFISLIVLTLYEVPAVFSYGIASFLILITVLLIEYLENKFSRKEVSKNDLFNLGKTFLIFVTCCGTIFTLICLQQNLNPLNRAIEFLKLCMSTNFWAFNTIGNSNTRIYSLLYSLLPILAVIGFTVSMKNYKKSKGYLVSLTLYLAYFLNFSRSLGRHGLNENQDQIVIWTFLLATMFLVSSKVKKHNKIVFMLSGLLIFIAIGTNELIMYNSNFTIAYNSARNTNITIDGPVEKVERVDLTPVLTAHNKPIELIEAVIPENDTYMDLSSFGIFYILSGKEKPVYVNQSPTVVTSEFAQEQFIRQVEEFDGNCNYALLGGITILDELQMQYREYLIYEYLYNNYRPIAATDESNYSIWVKNEKYDEAIERLKGTDVRLIDYSYYDESFHTYSLGMIPYLYGTYGEDKLWENDYIQVEDGVIFAKSQVGTNFIMITVDSDTNSTLIDVPNGASFNLYDESGNLLMKFNYTLILGVNNYIFRVSTDFNWDSGKNLIQSSASIYNEVERINGENWTNGVYNDNNVVLLKNQGTNLSKVSIANQISIDNIIYDIEFYEVTTDSKFIYVYIKNESRNSVTIDKQVVLLKDGQPIKDNINYTTKIILNSNK